MTVPASFASVVSDFEAVKASIPEPDHHLSAYAEGDEGPSFKDVLDTINPLQHIPIISTIYRELTGDQPGAIARIAGSALYGGPVGLAYEMVNSAIDDQTGKDVGGHAWATLFEDNNSDTAVKVATATPPETSPAVPDLPVSPPPVVAQEPIPLAKAADVQTPAAPQAQTLAPKILASASASTTPQAASAAYTAVGGQTQLPQGFLPVPSRHSIQVVPPTPPNTVLSTSNQRSNAMAVGVPRANTSQTDARGTAAVTMAGAKPIPVQAPASPPPINPTNAWVPDAMAKALDKYEKMSKLGQTAQIQEQPAP